MSQFPDELRNDLNDQQYFVEIFKYEYVSQGEYAVQVTTLADALKREGGAALLLLSPIWIIFAIAGAMLGYFSNEQVKQYVDGWFLTQKDNEAKYAQFLAALWDNEGMKKRFDALGQLKRKLVFKCFYAL
ncbi:hypothetical protein BDK51DRAFT_31003, partial [Blyttiomyces helicus]